VLVSEAAVLVRDALPPGAALADLGVHRLKDLGRPERIFQLTAAGLLAFAVPLALTVICWLGSPRSTALATWAMERTWAVRLDAITLTSSVRFFQ